MIKSGINVICEGCGESTFIESPINPGVYEHTLEGSKVAHYKPNQSDGCVRIFSSMDLCPRCQKIREQMLCKFYEECGAERDKANGVSV